ncbi:MAG TPA: MarR family transcriptional regulator [Chthoniobacterales bacterium]|nr:MarR family transcriptional regulator [Chthoniobacterales bacterium]
MEPQLTPEDYNALASFRYAMRKFLNFSRGILVAEADLTPEQYEALLALEAFANSRGLTIGELSERLQVKHHTAVALVAKLVGRGLVDRQSGASDRRQVFLRLNPAGKTLLAKVAAIHRQELRVRSPELMEALSRLQR